MVATIGRRVRTRQSLVHIAIELVVGASAENAAHSATPAKSRFCNLYNHYKSRPISNRLNVATCQKGQESVKKQKIAEIVAKLKRG